MNHYPPLAQKLFSKQITFAAVMSILALVMGLVYREAARPFFGGLTLDQQELYGRMMSLVHGHTFLLGAAIPAVMAVFTLLVLPNLSEKRLNNMNLRFTAYMIASSVALLLMVYKGMAFIVMAGQPLDVINNSLFFGNAIFRGILFGAAHITLFWALGEYMAGVLIAVRNPTK